MGGAWLPYKKRSNEANFKLTYISMVVHGFVLKHVFFAFSIQLSFLSFGSLLPECCIYFVCLLNDILCCLYREIWCPFLIFQKLMLTGTHAFIHIIMTMGDQGCILHQSSPHYNYLFIITFWGQWEVFKINVYLKSPRSFNVFFQCTIQLWYSTLMKYYRFNQGSRSRLTVGCVQTNMATMLCGKILLYC